MIKQISGIFFFLFLGMSLLQAQEEGSLQFIGHHFLNEKKLVETKVKIISHSATIAEFHTGESNTFKTDLKFGSVYDIYFTNARAQTAFIRVFADIPQNKRNLKTTYELDVPFFRCDPSIYDTSQFRNPFHQIIFDGKSRFIDDTVYMNAFLRKLVKVRPEDTSNYFIVKRTPIKQYVQLAGKLSLENDKQTPLKNKTLILTDKTGGKILTTQTSNHGIFVFQGVDTEVADGLQVQLIPSDNPNKEKIKLESNFHELIEYTSFDPVKGYQYHNDEKNNLIKKLVDKDYKYNVGGKLILVKGSFKKIASHKEVYLLNNKNSLIQRVTTDVFGNFLFTKIIPGQNYVMAFDTSDYTTNSKLELYTVKDKFVKQIDSLSAARFHYKFQAISGNQFNDLILDDSELKMNVKGRLYGDNKNNPLSNLRVLLLNDKFLAIDSATTNEKGDFSFNYMPYNRQLLISANNEKNILEAFNNILVFDNAENLIKIVSTLKGNKFDYRPLATEQSRLTEVYVDDPWLSVINRKKGSKEINQVIVENVLFEFDKADLLPQSKQTLDKIILAMQLNKEFSIELGAHSDSKGGDAYNLKLSEQRAASAKAYITDNGIEADRVVAKGYGETKLLNNCGNTILCSDDEHAVNRRLEFKLIFN